MPLHIYEGLSGKLITTILKPDRRNKQANVAKLLKKLISQLRTNVGFITGLAGNSKLHELAQVTIESAQREFNQYQKPVKRYHSFMYKAGSWENYQRVTVPGDQWSYA